MADSDEAETRISRKGGERMPNDIKWMIGVIAAAVILTGVGVAAIMVSVAMPQLSHMAAHMRSQEARIDASNNKVILELEWLFEGMRDEYRERMHGVEDVLLELRTIRHRLEVSQEAGAARMGDVERALSNVDRALSALVHSRPVRPRDVVQRLEEVRNELRAIRQRLEGPGGPGASTADQMNGQEPQDPEEPKGD